MKLAIRVVPILMLLAMALQSCTDVTEHRVTGNVNPSAQESEWTVLFYGAGTSAADLQLSGQSRTVAMVQGLERVFPVEQVHALGLLGTTSSDGHVRFVDIGFKPSDSGNTLSATELGDWGAQNMATPALLQQFADSAIARFPAHHYLLVMEGTGDGWKGSCRDEINGGGQLLSHPDMYNVIQSLRTPDGQPFHADVLLWLTPGMGNLEIAYEFRSVADYVIAAPSIAAQPGFMAMENWYFDLTLNPTMSSELLGQFVVSRMQQKAIAEHDSLATFDLMNISQMPLLANAVDDLSNALTAALPAHGARILTIWQQLWDGRTDDSASVDLKSFARVLAADTSLAGVPELVTAANEVSDQLQNVATYQRSTRADANRDGVMIYAPLAANAEEMNQYNALRLSLEHPAWASFLNAIQTTGPTLVEVNGEISWAGHTLQELYLFVNTAQAGAPNVYLTTPANITNTITPSDVAIQSSFALTDDSVQAYLGAFQDLDHSGTLTSGDRFGYYHHDSPSRDWLTIHNGDQMDSVNIVLTNTR